MSDRLTTIRKGVTLSFGMVSIPVDVASAVASGEGNTTVCCGHAEDQHAPIPIALQKTCAACGRVEESQVRKARKVGERLVVLDTEALKAAKNYEPYVREVGLVAHPAPQVAAGTISGDKVYYLLPAKGSETQYAALAELVAAHPELAFCGRYAPRTTVGMFQLTSQEVKGGKPVLVLYERVLASALKSAPVLTAEPKEGMVELAERVLKVSRRDLVTKFAPAAYADESEAAIAALVDAAADEGSQVSAAQTADTMLDALQQMLDAKKPSRRAKKVEAA